MRTTFEASFIVTDGQGNPSEPDDLSRHLDDVMDALMDLDVFDPDIEATLATGHVDISVTVEATDDFEAVEKSWAAMRTAVHTAGGYTGTWRLERLVEVDDRGETVPT